QAIHCGLGIVAQETADLDNRGRLDDREGIVRLFVDLENLVAELTLDALVCRQYIHPAYASTVAAGLPLALVSQRSFIIFSCSFSRPSVSASGRGGHPGTYTSTGRILSTPSHTE